MGNWPQDILDRIRSEYPSDIALIDSLLGDLKATCTHEAARVARCVLHLAEGDLNEFRRMHKAACQDSRDVIWWAEYDHPGKPDVRMRDFSKAFE